MKKLLLTTLLAGTLTTGVSAQETEPNVAYLFTYFTGNAPEEEQICYALSEDGYNYTPLNHGNPIVKSDTIAFTGCVRDPHILRGEDGKTFYMVVTDMKSALGWSSNRGMVLMKSTDLINWTHTVVRIDEAFPERFGKLGCAWAPETIWDPEEGKLMVYFTIRPTGKGKTKLYYAYANNDFTKLITEPELLFEYPDEKVQILDADIIPMPDGRYCMTYCSQEGPAGIKMAISDHINRGYQYQAPQIDAEPRSCEAPTMYKLIGQDKWILMYDIFSIKPHNFGFMETTDFNTFKHIGHFGDGPTRRDGFSEQKHGAVTVITEEEASNLENYWK